jgi:hypothetical protein
MPFKQIDTVLKWAKPIDAFVDIQVGLVPLKEVTELVKYLSLPNVHLGMILSFTKTDTFPVLKLVVYR